MSAFRYATVWCDESADSELMACGEYIEDNTAVEARREAKRRGWIVGVPKRYPGELPRDYCPTHRPHPKLDDIESP